MSTHAASGVLAAGDTVAVTVGTVTDIYPHRELVAGDATADAVALETGLANFINSSFTGVTAAITGGDLVITADTTVDATPTVTIAETTAGNGAIADTATTAGVDAVAVATTISGFTTGTGGDVISFDVSEISAVTGVTDLSDGDGDVAGGDAVVLLNYTVGTAFSDTDGVADGQNVIKVAYSNTINAFADLSTAIDANNITLDAAPGDDDVIATVFYDADAGNMIVGLLQQDAGGAALDDNLVFNEIASVAMSRSAYDSVNAANFSFVA